MHLKEQRGTHIAIRVTSCTWRAVCITKKGPRRGSEAHRVQQLVNSRGGLSAELRRVGRDEGGTEVDVSLWCTCRLEMRGGKWRG